VAAHHDQRFAARPNESLDPAILRGTINDDLILRWVVEFREGSNINGARRRKVVLLGTVIVLEALWVVGLIWLVSRTDDPFCATIRRP
jgi:hypothetical protein